MDKKKKRKNILHNGRKDIFSKSLSWYNILNMIVIINQLTNFIELYIGLMKFIKELTTTKDWNQ